MAAAAGAGSGGSSGRISLGDLSRYLRPDSDETLELVDDKIQVAAGRVRTLAAVGGELRIAEELGRRLPELSKEDRAVAEKIIAKVGRVSEVLQSRIAAASRLRRDELAVLPETVEIDIRSINVAEGKVEHAPADYVLSEAARRVLLGAEADVVVEDEQDALNLLAVAEFYGSSRLAKIAIAGLMAAARARGEIAPELIVAYCQNSPFPFAQELARFIKERAGGGPWVGDLRRNLARLQHEGNDKLAWTEALQGSFARALKEEDALVNNYILSSLIEAPGGAVLVRELLPADSAGLKKLIQWAAEGHHEAFLLPLLAAEGPLQRLTEDERDSCLRAAIYSAAQAGDDVLLWKLLAVDGPWSRISRGWRGLETDRQDQALWDAIRASAEQGDERILLQLLNPKGPYWGRFTNDEARDEAVIDAIGAAGAGHVALVWKLLAKDGPWERLITDERKARALRGAAEGFAKSGQVEALRELLRADGPYWLRLTVKGKNDVLLHAVTGAAESGRKELLDELVKETGPYWSHMRNSVLAFASMRAARGGRRQLVQALLAEPYWSRITDEKNRDLAIIWAMVEAAEKADRELLRLLIVGRDAPIRRISKPEDRETLERALGALGDRALAAELRAGWEASWRKE